MRRLSLRIKFGFKIQIEIGIEFKIGLESIKTISSLDWNEPLYFNKPGNCKIFFEIFKRPHVTFKISAKAYESVTFNVKKEIFYETLGQFNIKNFSF